jgi:hypothetical protein
MAKAFHFMVRASEPLKMFRPGSIGNLADSTREVGGAEVDVGKPRASKCGTSEVELLEAGHMARVPLLPTNPR